MVKTTTGDAMNLPPDGFADETSGPPDGFADEDRGIINRTISGAGKDISGIAETLRRGGQGILDFPSDTYQTGKQVINGQPISETPLGQDVKTLGNVALESLPHTVNEGGSYKIEPGSIYRQYEDLAAQPLKYIPRKVGQEMKKAYPENPLIEHPVNSALALAPLAKPLLGAAREIPGVQPALENTAENIRQEYVAPNSRRALGKFPMKMPVEEANKIGLEAMDQGVIKNPITHPLQSTRSSMLGRVSDLNESIGENIGSFLKGQNESLDTTRAMQELDQVKSQFMHDPQIVSKVENAKELISKNSTNPVQSVMRLKDEPQKMEFAPANKLKRLFQDKTNYFSDEANQQGSKAVAGNFRNSIDTQLDELTAKLGNREGMDQFKADKKLFGSTRNMEDVLTGQVNRDARNMPVSLPAVGVGIGGFIKGGGLKGVLTGLAAEWTKRYGSAAAASIANDVAQALKNGELPSVPPAVGISPAISKSTSKTITKDKVREFKDQANGDIPLAKKLAKKAGYSW